MAQLLRLLMRDAGRRSNARTRGGVTVKIAGFPIVFVPQKKGGGGKTHHTETHTEEHTETKD